MMIEKFLSCAQVKATPGRDTRAVSSDGVLDLRMTAPRELGGAGVQGTTAEHLFAAAYAACFLGTMKSIAANDEIPLPEHAAVEADVGVGPVPLGGFGLEVELKISLPGLPRAEADYLVEQSHRVCPYSKATRGNVAVRLVFA